MKYLLLTSLLIGLNAYALKVSEKQYQILKQALDLPLNQRTQFFQKRPHFFVYLKHIFQTQESSPSMKWQALMSMTRLNPQKARSHIDQALNSHDWFLKNAGLIALEIIQPEEAVRKASEFLDHPALMLRTASVELIRRRKAKQYKDILWTQLGAKENFRNGKSLWVRYTIAQTLSEFSDHTDQDLFLTLLEDADPRIHSIAIRALQRIQPFQKAKFKKPSMLAREKTQKKTL